MFKINPDKWQEVVYYINNFFLPLQYTNGKGIYPDRLTLARARNLDEMFGDSHDVEFAILNARATDSRHKILLSRQNIEKYLLSPLSMMDILGGQNERYYSLFDKVAHALSRTTTVDFDKLNRFVVSAYNMLEPADLLKISDFRERALSICARENLMSEQFCREQMAMLSSPQTL